MSPLTAIHSCKSYVKQSGRRRQTERGRAVSAGVTIAGKNTFLTQASVTPVKFNDTAAKVHRKAVQIMPPRSECLNIWGVIHTT